MICSSPILDLYSAALGVLCAYPFFLIPSFINPLTYHMLFFAIYIYSMSTKIRIIFTGPYMWSVIVWKKAMYMHLVRFLKSATQFTRRLISGVEHSIEYVVKGTKDCRSLAGPTSWPTLWYIDYDHDTIVSVATSGTEIVADRQSAVLSEIVL